MSLDIGIGDGVRPVPLESEPSLWLSNDGYYWFLHPLFERLHAETGQYIDLYGDASFSGKSMMALERLAADAKKLVRSQPPTWRVHTGTQLAPEQKEVYSEVEKARFMELLVKLDQIIQRAKEIGQPVVCFGD
jgi:hypothetical protein